MVELEAGFPVPAAVEPAGDVVPGSLPGGTAARVEHHGPYDRLGESWEALLAWLEAEGHQPGPVLWETYVTEPSPEVDPSDLVTELTWLLR